MRLLLLTLLLTSCTVGTLATTTPTPAPTATPWPTNTSSPTAAATDAPTPTAEIGCMPLSYGTVWEDTYLYGDSYLSKPLDYHITGNGAITWEYITIKAGTQVLFLYGRTTQARMVVMVNGLDERGWIPVSVLSPECR